MSNIANLYYWDLFLKKHYKKIRNKTDKNQVEIINYLHKWYQSIT